jgi:uncharacterized protein YndB with AHSA1/START domain
VTDPSLLARWLTRDAVVDLRAGGAYRAGDGDRGTYLEVERNRKLRFTWDNPGHCPGTIVTITLAPLEGGATLLRLAHGGLASKRDLAHMRRGWSEALDLLAALFARRVRDLRTARGRISGGRRV